MKHPPLINEDGSPFSASALTKARAVLDALPDADRIAYRDGNALALAQHGATRMLIMSGPGTGKSSLFKLRIHAWLTKQPHAAILALTFVRKLVVDLQNDISNDLTLSDDQKRKVQVSTLHRYARSIVERNHGCRQVGLAKHARIISGIWKDVVWGDACLLAGQPPDGTFPLAAFESQYHNATFDTSPEWLAMHRVHGALCTFYNAVGFAELIVFAAQALKEAPDVVEQTHFIVDEYQDFNHAEEKLIARLTATSAGVLIVGDDDQVLYDGLKASKPEIIRARYAEGEFVNGMLPFCGRCGLHIVRAASAFLSSRGSLDRVDKLLLPLSGATTTSKVRVVACATPTTAVDYVSKFVADHSEEIARRKEDLVEGRAKDPFLLILTPVGDIGFYGKHSETLRSLVASYAVARKQFSDDYLRTLTYYSWANRPADNFSCRKVLWYEGVQPVDAFTAVSQAMADNTALSDVDAPFVRTARLNADAVSTILKSSETVDDKARLVSETITISDVPQFAKELTGNPIGTDAEKSAEQREDEDAEREELGVREMAAVELMTMVGAKGLSADHVIVLGFDDINMSYVSVNAFFVAMTRARSSLHFLTALGAKGATKPHAYLDNLPDECLEHCGYKKGPPSELWSIGSKAALISYLTRLVSMRRPNTQ